MRKDDALRQAKLKAKRRARRKLEEARRMEPEICAGCDLPLPPGKRFKHDWCY